MFPCQKVGVVDYLGTWDYCSYLCNFVFPIGLLTYEQAYFVKYVTKLAPKTNKGNEQVVFRKLVHVLCSGALRDRKGKHLFDHVCHHKAML